MEQEKKQKISDTLSERGVWIKVGGLSILFKPLTLAQIYDMGAASATIDGSDLQSMDKINIIASLMKHAKDAKAMQDIFLICAFRKKWKRKLFGRYIRTRLTVEHFNKLLSVIATTFNANFFLTSIIFLSQTKIVTEPSSTTAHGQSSVE